MFLGGLGGLRREEEQQGVQQIGIQFFIDILSDGPCEDLSYSIILQQFNHVRSELRLSL